MRPAKSKSNSRVATGIEGLDKLIEGGFKRGDLILVAGNAGAGKTILAAQFLFDGLAKRNEPGIYVSFAEDYSAFCINMKRMGMDFEPFTKNGSFKFLEMITTNYEGVPFSIETICDEIDRIKAKRLVIDSVSVLLQTLSEKSEGRILLHTILSKVVRSKGVTTIMISEEPVEFDSRRPRIEEFVADAVITMSYSPERASIGRKLLVQKMRGTKFDLNQLSYVINSGGIAVYSRPEASEITHVYSARVKFGEKNIDKMLSGGLFKGSTTLVAGSAGTGKTSLSLQFVYQGIKHNEHCVYLTLEEPNEQLLRHCRSFGWNVASAQTKRLLNFTQIRLNRFALEEQVQQILQIFSDIKPTRFVLDGVAELSKLMDDDDFHEFIQILESKMKACGATAILTTTTESNPESKDHFLAGNLSVISDNVLYLRFVELEGKMKVVITIIKERGSGHSDDIVEFKVTNHGVSIGKSMSEYEGITSGIARKVSKSIDDVLQKIDLVLPTRTRIGESDKGNLIDATAKKPNSGKSGGKPSLIKALSK